jgi:hypothetical protein
MAKLVTSSDICLKHFKSVSICRLFSFAFPWHYYICAVDFLEEVEEVKVEEEEEEAVGGEEVEEEEAVALGVLSDAKNIP